MPNLAQFKNTAPQSGEIRVLYREVNGLDVIKAISVSTTSNNGQDVSLSLAELEEIQFAVSASGFTPKLIVQEGSKKSDYFYFNTADVTIASVSSSNDSVVNITPFLLEKFKNNDYNALISNASISRTSKFKFDVDRLEGNTVLHYKVNTSSSLPVRPTNYESILSGSATLAAVQDSNYTHTGHINARYNGTETSAADFGGINPAISGTPFEAAVYLSGSDTNFICSKSLSDRDIETYLFTGTSDTPISGSRIFQIDESRVIPLTNRKVWIKDNRNIVTLDNLGYVSGSITECSL